MALPGTVVGLTGTIVMAQQLAANNQSLLDNGLMNHVTQDVEAAQVELVRLNRAVDENDTAFKNRVEEVMRTLSNQIDGSMANVIADVDGSAQGRIDVALQAIGNSTGLMRRDIQAMKDDLTEEKNRRTVWEQQAVAAIYHQNEIRNQQARAGGGVDATRIQGMMQEGSRQMQNQLAEVQRTRAEIQQALDGAAGRGIPVNAHGGGQPREQRVPPILDSKVWINFRVLSGESTGFREWNTKLKNLFGQSRPGKEGVMYKEIIRDLERLAAAYMDKPEDLEET